MINHPNRSKATKAKGETPITADVVQKLLKVVDCGLTQGLGVEEPGKMCVEAAVCYALDLPHGDKPPCVSPALRALKVGLNDSRWSSDQARAKGLRRLAVAQLGSAGFLDESAFIKRILGAVIRKMFPPAFRACASIAKTKSKKAQWTDLASRFESAPAEITAREARQFFFDAKTAAGAAAAADDADAAYAYAAAAYAAAAADDAAYAAAAAAYAAAAAAAYAAYAAAAAAYAAYAAAAAAYDADAAAAYDADAYAAAAYAAAAYAAAAAYKKRNDARDKSLATFCEEVVQILISMKAPGCQWLGLTEIAA